MIVRQQSQSNTLYKCNAEFYVMSLHFVLLLKICETKTNNIYPNVGFDSEAVWLILVLLYLAGDFSHFTTFTKVYDVGRLVW